MAILRQVALPNCSRMEPTRVCLTRVEVARLGGSQGYIVATRLSKSQLLVQSHNRRMKLPQRRRRPSIVLEIFECHAYDINRQSL
jgi:hypothetical protein